MMPSDDSDATVAATWFLQSEENEPLGQVCWVAGEAVPAAGAAITGGAAWNIAEVVRFIELRPTCAMRRFEVIIRVAG